MCDRCPLSSHCPIQEFPADSAPHQLARNPLLDHDPDPSRTAGPAAPVSTATPEEVLLTIDSLGDADPALAAHPDLPAVFVFNRAALNKLQFSARRIGFYLQTLQDLAPRRDLRVYIGDPYEYARHQQVAVTFAPVPSFAKMPAVAELHPFPWLRRPHAGSVRSFSSWRTHL